MQLFILATKNNSRKEINEIAYYTYLLNVSFKNIFIAINISEDNIISKL